jgi:formylmethanofuran dehydrogenase subunit E
MNYQCEEAKLSANEIQEIHRNMEARGLSHVFCQACSEEMKPEQARKSSTGLIVCRPCYMSNDTQATQEEIDQALEEDFPGYLASFNQP